MISFGMYFEHLQIALSRQVETKPAKKRKFCPGPLMIKILVPTFLFIL